MAKEVKSSYKISDVYQGGYSSLSPPSSSYATAGSFGITTDPRNANILKEVSDKLSSGVKNIEIEGVSPEVFDSIPKQQLKEVHRLSKLTGIDVSLHGPVINVAGFTQNGYSDSDREISERKVAETLLRSHELNPDGNINVNFHSSEGVPGSQMLPPSEREKAGTKYKRLIVVNKETGRMAPLEPETEYYPEMSEEEIKKGKSKTPESRIKTLNETEWDNSLNQLFFNQERVKEILDKTEPLLKPVMNPKTGELPKFEELPPSIQPEIAKRFYTAGNYLKDLHHHANSLFSKAYKYGTSEQKHELEKLSEQFKKTIENGGNNPFRQAEAMSFLLNKLREERYIPEMYVPVEQFSIEKGSETYGNAAWQSYKKFRDKSPVLVIENPPAGQAIATGKDIRDIVVKSREKFIQNAVKEGMSESQAKREAEKFIGATWDVGHVNMLRKYGYSEKEIIEEAKEVAPLIKHVHLSDNFGFEHTELPMGMGNVPLKEIMEKLGKKGFEAKKIIEAGHWWQHFRTPPFQETLENTGSPIYSMKMAPYWNQSLGFYQGYLPGMEGQWLPQINYETFGTGFSRLPAELGGQKQGAQGSRMSGRPME